MFTRWFTGCCAVLVLSSAVLSCHSEPGGDPSEPAEVSIAAGAELPDVIARVNGTPIDRIEFERAVRAQEQQAGQPVPLQLRDAVYQSVLDRLVAFHLLMQESETREVSVAPEAIDGEIDRIRTKFTSDEEFEAQLATWQTSLDVLREEARKDLVVARVIELEIEPKLSLNESSVRGFYEQHQDQFTEPKAIRASHILIGVPENANDATRTDAQERAQRILAGAQEGTSFAELARTHSEDAATATEGGDLGFVVPGQTVPPFEEALFALQPGSVSDLVRSPFGFHIIQARERRPERVILFAEASGTIRLMLLDREREVLTASFIAELKAASTIEVYL